MDADIFRRYSIRKVAEKEIIQLGILGDNLQNYSMNGSSTQNLIK